MELWLVIIFSNISMKAENIFHSINEAKGHISLDGKNCTSFFLLYITYGIRSDFCYVSNENNDQLEVNQHSNWSIPEGNNKSKHCNKMVFE